jgi:hypothetical protein
MGENEDLRRFCTSMDKKKQPAAYESMMDIQTAQRMAQKTKEAEKFMARREAGFMYETQFDMRERWGRTHDRPQRQLRASRNTPQQATNRQPSTHAREPKRPSNGERGYSHLFFW